jgi:hypothetical protein
LPCTCIEVEGVNRGAGKEKGETHLRKLLPAVLSLFTDDELEPQVRIVRITSDLLKLVAEANKAKCVLSVRSKSAVRENDE